MNERAELSHAVSERTTVRFQGWKRALALAEEGKTSAGEPYVRDAGDDWSHRLLQERI